MGKLKLAICGNELNKDTHLWENACEHRKDDVDYEVISLTGNDWLEQIKKADADWYVFKPSHVNSYYKQLYDERVLIMEEELGLNIFPSRKEVFLYENKRYLSFFLKSNGIPHPKTDIFYNKAEANAFLSKESFPIVGKTNIGASGSGVTIIKSLVEAKDYVEDVFTGKGAKQRTGPNTEKPGIVKRGFKLLMNPTKLAHRVSTYKNVGKEQQTQFVIFQRHTPHDHEWRAVRIGDSFFAHKKMKLGEKASGSLLKNYDNPPIELFDFVKEVTDRFKLYSQAVDVFETEDGFLINEMQCIFGQSDPYQMLVDGKMGRYISKEGNWLFEEGDFAKNQCYDLRIDFMLSRSAAMKI